MTNEHHTVAAARAHYTQTKRIVAQLMPRKWPETVDELMHRRALTDMRFRASTALARAVKAAKREIA